MITQITSFLSLGPRLLVSFADTMATLTIHFFNQFLPEDQVFVIKEVKPLDELSTPEEANLHYAEQCMAVATFLPLSLWFLAKTIYHCKNCTAHIKDTVNPPPTLYTPQKDAWDAANHPRSRRYQPSTVRKISISSNASSSDPSNPDSKTWVDQEQSLPQGSYKKIYSRKNNSYIVVRNRNSR